MTDTSVDQAQLEAWLRAVGLIPRDYSGEVVVSAATSEGSENVTISV